MINTQSKTLKKNSSSHAIFSILSSAKDHGKTVIAWKMSLGKKVTAEVFLRVIRKSRGEILFKGVDATNQKVLSSLVSGAETLNIFLPEELVLFQSKLKHFDSSGDVILEIPEMIAQVDRRKNLRLTIPDWLSVKARFVKKTKSKTGSNQLFKRDKGEEKGQQLEKECFDISAGGLSFIVSRAESKLYSAGESIEGIQLLFKEREVHVAGTVVNILDVEPNGGNGLHYRGRKICVNFNHVEKEDRIFLENFVFRHADLSDAV